MAYSQSDALAYVPYTIIQWHLEGSVVKVYPNFCLTLYTKCAE